MASSIVLGTRAQESEIPISERNLKICNDMMERLKKLNWPEASLITFLQEIFQHFSRLPNGYSINGNIGATEVLLHMKMLKLAKYSSNGYAIHISLIKVHSLDIENNKIIDPVNELIFASEDSPKLLIQLTNTLVGMGLHIKEAFCFSTIDGYALYTILVTGSLFETSRELEKVVEKEFLKTKIASSMVTKPPQICRRSFWSSWTWVASPKATEPLSFWSSLWTCLEVLFFLISSVMAVYFLVVAVALRYGAKRDHEFLYIADCVGNLLISHESSVSDKDKDIGFALVFIAIPFLGILSVLLILINGIYTSILLKTRVPIIIWLIMGWILGGFVPFVKLKIASVYDKSAPMFSVLVTAIATLTNFYRKK